MDLEANIPQLYGASDLAIPQASLETGIGTGKAARQGPTHGPSPLGMVSIGLLLSTRVIIHLSGRMRILSPIYFVSQRFQRF